MIACCMFYGECMATPVVFHLVDNYYVYQTTPYDLNKISLEAAGIPSSNTGTIEKIGEWVLGRWLLLKDLRWFSLGNHF
jgi:hypothetical protein